MKKNKKLLSEEEKRLRHLEKAKKRALREDDNKEVIKILREEKTLLKELEANSE
jgi:hypothetical protein